ncbi:MAG: manganese efflux pump MntP family protein [Desulfobacterales bacterium]|nr:manganese efflux pump MntP family protein [Desulfobacterales bacterium]
MSIIEIILIAAGLAMDASAVSLSAAAAGYAKDGRAAFRLAFHFGLFQFLMPVIGWMGGIHFVSYFSSIDNWIAFGLLSFVGFKMIREGMNPTPDKQKKDPSRGMTMVMLSVATSIDALAVGLSFAVLNTNIWVPSVMIGIITVLLSYLAIQIGNRLGVLLGSRLEVVGGLVLFGIGVKILFFN